MLAPLLVDANSARSNPFDTYSIAACVHSTGATGRFGLKFRGSGLQQADLIGGEVIELISQPVDGVVGGGDVLLDAAPLVAVEARGLQSRYRLLDNFNFDFGMVVYLINQTVNHFVCGRNIPFDAAALTAVKARVL